MGSTRGQRLEADGARRSAPDDHALLALLDQRIRAIVKEALDMGRGDDWVSQDESPLGRRTHCKLVREGRLLGHKVGKKILVRRTELDRFIETHAVKPPELSPESEPAGDEIDHELERLGFVRGAA